MEIRTKIVATVGPACPDAEALSGLARAGVDVFRINFSHGGPEQHEQFLAAVRAAEGAVGRPLAVLGDLCGPKIRVGTIGGGAVLMPEGHEIIIQRHPIVGNAQRISTTLAELADEVREGEMILLDDGKLELQVTETRPPEAFVCRVLRGGMLASGKGLNLPHTDLQLSALTEKDRGDVAWLLGREFDYVALSFVRSAEDIRALRALLDAGGCAAHIIAKIEKPRALTCIAEIADAADGLMIARGDLGVEMSLPSVPVAQKRLARLCLSAGKPCIIATQMLETMTDAPTPTRAEVSDVANAVLDYADAVMLSGETAVGNHAALAVQTMNEIVEAMQSYHDETFEPAKVTFAPCPTAAGLAAATRDIVAEQDIAAVAVFTLTGTTARMFAKHRLSVPILGISPDLATVRRMCLYYGVEAVQGRMVRYTDEVLEMAAELAVQRGLATSGEKIVVVLGRPLGEAARTNTLVVHTVP